MYLHDLVARPLHRGRRGAAIQITAEGELVPEVQQGERGVSEGRGHDAGSVGRRWRACQD